MHISCRESCNLVYTEGSRHGSEAIQAGARRSGEGQGRHRPEIPAFMNRDASVARACAAIEEAGRHGAHLVVFPEAWLAGYPYWTEGWDSSLPQWAGGASCSGTTRWSCRGGQRAPRACRPACRVYVALGCNEMDPRPEVQTIYNSLIFFAPDGTVLGRHRKLMPTFTERLFWARAMRATSWSSTRISGGSAA